MKQEEISILAKTACSWLAYKSLTGFNDILIEAMLSVPIAEFFASRRDWLLEQQVHYRKFASVSELPSFWCDFGGKRRYGKAYSFLLETKFLKQKARYVAKDLAADVLRLSLPLEKDVKRIFFLAGDSDYFPKPNEEFLFSRMFGLGRQRGCNLNPADAKLDAGFQKHYQNLIEKPYIPAAIYTQCRAIEEVSTGNNAKVKVVAWTVARTA